MTSTSLTSEPKSDYKVDIPDWLNQCLISPQDDYHNNLICRAFQFAYSLHQGQYRKSGDAYIAHPIAVAELLRDLGGDSEMIAAGFLHDVVEDTEVTPEDIEGKIRGKCASISRSSN